MKMAKVKSNGSRVGVRFVAVTITDLLVTSGKGRELKGLVSGGGGGGGVWHVYGGY